MVKAYTQHVSTRQTPQTEQALDRPEQVQNNAGGFVFQVDKWTMLDRWLILGSESPTYYVGQKELTLHNVRGLRDCIQESGVKTVQRITNISVQGRAPKNDPAIFALAMCCDPKIANLDTRRAAFEALPKVCRTGYHLFQFMNAVKSFRKMGSGLRNAIRRWYTEKEPRDLAYQVTKYQQREGWSHRDVLRMTKPRPKDLQQSVIFGWSTENPKARSFINTAQEPIFAFECAKKAASKHEIVKLIEQYGLVRECIPTKFLKEPEVWEALLEKMPMTAMIRNLATMTVRGLLSPMSSATMTVCERLTDTERLHKSRIHPMAVLIAMKIYASGQGFRSNQQWNPVTSIIDALDDSFYRSFKNVEPTGKRWLLGVDVSGSMQDPISGCQFIQCREAAGALALVTAATEPNHMIAAFSDGKYKSLHSRGYHNLGSGLTPVNLSPRMRLDNAVQELAKIPMGGTNCAVPMLYALEQNIPIDVFVVITDNETWCGYIHPYQALREYRQRTGIPAKLIVMAMTPSQFTIADPKDAGMLDVVGFDASVPILMHDFATDFHVGLP